MWDGEPYHLDKPLTAYVQTDWTFNNPISGQVLTYTKGEEVTVEFVIPARCNVPFGFPFVWGDNAKPFPLWLLEEEEPDGAR